MPDVRHRGTTAAAIFGILVALAPVAAAQQPPGDPTRYCEGDGGPLGAASDAEHSVLLGEAPLPAGLRSRRVSVDGVSTRVVEGGPAAAREAVVFVHGSPGSARDYDDLLTAGGAFARTVAFDMSGYGESDHFASQVQSTEGAARFIGRALEELGVRRAVIVMHDFGGPWSIPWAIEHPDALIGAVIMNSGVLIDYVPHPFALIWSMPVAGELQMASTTRDGWRRMMQVSNPRGLPQEFVDRMYDNYDRATRCAALRYYRSAIRPENASNARRQADELRKHPRPALVIWGERDMFIPPKHAQDQREAFPDAQIHMLPDSGHWPFVDNAERTRELFVSFLRPRLAAAVPRATAGARRLKVRVRADGLLPGYDVRARVRSFGASAPRTVGGRRTLVIPLRRALPAGRRVVTVEGRGLGPLRIEFDVAKRGR